MTRQQLYLFSCLYLTIFVVVAVLTRATLRRLVGALLGAAVMGGAGLGVIAIGESARWWHFVMPLEPSFLSLMWIGMIPCGFLFLITWPIARRFGGRGLAVTVCVVAVVGPLRNSWYMARFPEWGSYASVFAPILATSGAYVLLGIIGNGLMRLVAGPAAEDRLARRPWRPARSSFVLELDYNHILAIVQGLLASRSWPNSIRRLFNVRVADHPPGAVDKHYTV